MPAGEGGEENKTDEGENNGNDTVAESVSFFDQGVRAKGQEEILHQIREHNHILKLRSQPDEIERILVDRDLVG